VFRNDGCFEIQQGPIVGLGNKTCSVSTKFETLPTLSMPLLKNRTPALCLLRREKSAKSKGSPSFETIEHCGN